MTCPSRNSCYKHYRIIVNSVLSTQQNWRLRTRAAQNINKEEKHCRLHQNVYSLTFTTLPATSTFDERQTGNLGPLSPHPHLPPSILLISNDAPGILQRMGNHKQKLRRNLQNTRFDQVMSMPKANNTVCSAISQMPCTPSTRPALRQAAALALTQLRQDAERFEGTGVMEVVDTPVAMVPPVVGARAVLVGQSAVVVLLVVAAEAAAEAAAAALAIWRS